MAQFIPPLTWFRAFESAARHLSFTKAAKELSLTQSAISQHVRSLEAQLGCELFIRKHRSLTLTDQGRRLVPYVANAISTLASATATFEVSAEKIVLTVAASPSIARWCVVPDLKTFVDNNPHVAVRLITKTWPDEFSGSEVDAEIRFDTALSAGRSAKLLHQNKLQICAAPSLVAHLGESSLKPRDILSLPLIQVMGTSDTWQKWAEHHELEDPLNIVAQVESHGLAVEMARTGLGAVCTNSLIVRRSLMDGSVVLLNEPGIDPKEGYYLKIRNTENRTLSERFAHWLFANNDMGLAG